MQLPLLLPKISASYEKGNLASMTFCCENPNSASVNYHLDVTKRTGKEILMKESYSLFERMHTTKVIHFDFGKQECDMTGDYFQYPTSNEFTFSEIIRCEKMQKSEWKLLFCIFNSEVVLKNGRCKIANKSLCRATHEINLYSPGQVPCSLLMPPSKIEADSCRNVKSLK